ncbi:hypothetical protein AAG570_013489 [Ranatra chinensis]|uniref:Uncharacterized protein n=1 Tax=Ranatra chinensis TaxID=642074 RepID=A0ABD0YCB4_9HEMI
MIEEGAVDICPNELKGLKQSLDLHRAQLEEVRQDLGERIRELEQWKHNWEMQKGSLIPQKKSGNSEEARFQSIEEEEEQPQTTLTEKRENDEHSLRQSGSEVENSSGFCLQAKETGIKNWESFSRKLKQLEEREVKLEEDIALLQYNGNNLNRMASELGRKINWKRLISKISSGPLVKTFLNIFFPVVTKVFGYCEFLNGPPLEEEMEILCKMVQDIDESLSDLLKQKEELSVVLVFMRREFS